MTKSNKKTYVVFVRDLKPKTKEANESIKKRILESYKNELNSHLKLMEDIGSSIEKNKKEQYQTSVLAHRKITKLSLIEGVSILDYHINIALEEFQKNKLSLKKKEIKSFQKVEEGLKELLKNVKVTKEFSKKHPIIKNFRILRNKFAHSPLKNYGSLLFISNKEENFEMFLEKLKGIKINEKSYWVQSTQGKIGRVIFYNIISNEFIDIFLQESLNFFTALIEILFSQEIKN